MANSDECIDLIVKASDGTMSRREAAAQVRKLVEQAESEKAAGVTESLDTVVTDLAERLADQQKFAAMVNKRKAAIQIVKTNAIKDYVRTFIAGDPEKVGDAIKAFLGGTVEGSKLSRKSLDYAGKQLMEVSLGRELLGPLERAGVLDDFISDKFETEIIQELFELNSKTGKPGKTGQKNALVIARQIQNVTKKLFHRKNRAGATEFELDAFITSQTHDPFRVRRGGKPVRVLDPRTWKPMSMDDAFKEWQAEILEGLNVQRSFPRMSKSEIADAMREDFNGFVHGHHIRNDAKIGQSRTYHFKDAKAWQKYNDKFGRGNLRNTVLGSIEHQAREIALMEHFGPEARQTFKKVISDLKDEYQHSEAAIKGLDDWKIKAMFNNLDGTTRRPSNASWAAFWAFERSIQTGSKMGGSGIHSIPDIATTSAELNFQGVALAQGYRRSLGALVEGRGGAEKKKIAMAFGSGIHGMTSQAHSRWGIADPIRGFSGRLQNLVFKINGQNYLDDSLQSGVAWVMANFHGDNAHLTLKKLPKKLQELFDLYGVTEAQWDLYRETVWKGVDGQNFLTSDRIREIPEAKMKEHLKAQGKTVSKANLERAYDELDQLFSMIVVDRQDFAVPRPGAAEMVYLNGGLPPGSFYGEVIRNILQFKGFLITAARKGLGKHFTGKGPLPILDKSRIGGIAHYMAMTSVLGYLGYAATDIAKGKKPRPLSRATILDAFAKGGGAGIYGDFLWGEWKKFGRSFLGALAGPTFSQVDSVAEIISSAQRGEDTGANMWRFVEGNIPLINVYWARGALDYLILYQMREWLNPGYLNRMERRMEREFDREFFLPPSRVIPRGGGDFPGQGAVGVAQEIKEAVTE